MQMNENPMRESLDKKPIHIDLEDHMTERKSNSNSAVQRNGTKQSNMNNKTRLPTSNAVNDGNKIHMKSDANKIPVAVPVLDKLFYYMGISKEPGVLFSSKPGFYDEENDKILSYNPAKLRNILFPFISSDLSACYHWQIWLRHLAMVFYAIAIQLISVQVGFPDGHYGSGWSCLWPSGKSANISTCSLEKTLKDAKTEFRFLIAFILAGFVASSIGKWSKRRTNYASLCGNVRNTILHITSLIPSDIEMLPVRRNLCRWVILAFELAMLKARGHMDDDEGKQFLENAGLIEDGEWDSMVPGDRHTTALFWVLQQVKNLSNKKSCDEKETGRSYVISHDVLVRISECVGSMRGQANDLMSSLDRDNPIPYSALCGILVQINVLIFSSWKGIEWSIWQWSQGDRLFEEPRWWLDVMVLFAWNISYVALYDLGYMLHNPFGNRRIDVAHETIGFGLRKLGTSLAEGTKFHPPTMI